MADTSIQIKDTHVTYTFPIVDQDDKTVDLTSANSATLVARPEQNDESTKVCTINPNVDSGTYTSTSASILTHTGQNFTDTVTVGDILVITTGSDVGSYVITEVTSDEELTVAETFVGDTAQTYYITDGSVSVQPDSEMFNVGDQEVRVKIVWNDATISPTVTKFIIEGLS